MRRMTNPLAAALAVALLAVAGCGPSTPAPTTPEPAPAPEPTQPEPVMGGVVGGAEGAPATQPAPEPPPPPPAVKVPIVASVNLAKVRQSRLFKSYEKELRGAFGPQLAQLRKGCNFDPFRDVGQVVLLIDVFEDDAPDANVMAIVRGLDRKKTTRCFPVLSKIAEDKGQPVTFADEGEYLRYEHGDTTRWLLWADGKTLIGGNHSQEQLVARKGQLAAPYGNDDVGDLIGAVDTTRAVHVAVAGGEARFYLSIGLDKGFGLHGGWRLGSPEEAEQNLAMARMALSQAPQGVLGELVAKLVLGTDESDVTFRLEMNHKELSDFLAKARTDPQVMMMWAALVSQLGG